MARVTVGLVAGTELVLESLQSSHAACCRERIVLEEGLGVESTEAGDAGWTWAETAAVAGIVAVHATE